MADVTQGSRQVDAIAWALFFIWVGVALLAKISWAWSLLGISAIILGSQAASYLGANRIDGFWTACGLVFLVAGIWELVGLTWSLAPVLLVLLGSGHVGQRAARYYRAYLPYVIATHTQMSGRSVGQGRRQVSEMLRRTTFFNN